MTLRTCDLAIVVPTVEEFKELRNLFPLLDTHPEGGVTYYRLRVPGTELRAVAVVLGAMGPTPASDYAGRLIDHCKPEAIALVGLGGALDPDLKLGDVVVASEINEFEAAAKAVPSRNTFRVRDSGRHWDTNASLHRCAGELELAEQALFEEWQANSAAFRSTLPSDPSDALFARERPAIRVGPIASGDIVVAAEAMKARLVGINRKFLAVEMEAAGVAQAAHSREPSVRLLVVRGLSDFSDSRKEELDSSGTGKWRKYAMYSAAHFLLSLLRTAPLQRVLTPAGFTIVETAPVVPGAGPRRAPGKARENPFRFAKPVRGREFHDRASEVQEVRDLITTDQSAILVGGPKIGKTSLLLRVQDDLAAGALPAATPPAYTFSYLDLLAVREDFSPVQFWPQALQPLSVSLALDPVVARCLGEAEATKYADTQIESLFGALAGAGQRLVLLLDEFDCLTEHTQFRSYVFFALLRHLAGISRGLIVVATSQWSAQDLNDWGRKRLHKGSSLFDYLAPIPLGPFKRQSALGLLDQAEPPFTDQHREWILRIAGTHPYLVQAAAYLLFAARERGEIDSAQGERKFRETVAPHFADVWEKLEPDARAMAHVLSGVAGSQLQQVRKPVEALRRLEELGLAARVDITTPASGVSEILDFHGQSWSIAPQAFISWLREESLPG